MALSPICSSHFALSCRRPFHYWGYCRLSLTLGFHSDFLVLSPCQKLFPKVRWSFLVNDLSSICCTRTVLPSLFCLCLPASGAADNFWGSKWIDPFRSLRPTYPPSFCWSWPRSLSSSGLWGSSCWGFSRSLWEQTWWECLFYGLNRVDSRNLVSHLVSGGLDFHTILSFTCLLYLTTKS